MNPIKTKIVERLNSFPEWLAPITSACKRHLHLCCAVDPNDNLLVAHQPWEGLLRYRIALWAPTKTTSFARFSSLHGIQIPQAIQKLLVHFNGGHLFGMTLFGILASMLEDPPVLSRAVLQCLDIGLAQQQWKLEYRRKGLGFYFGTCEYSDTEVVGYFLSNDGRIQAVSQEGRLHREWTDFTQFLADEIAATEARDSAAVPDDWWKE